MTPTEVKQRLMAIVDELPPDKAQSLLDYAAFLGQRAFDDQASGNDSPALNDWDRAIIAAEEYWFSLPEAKRKEFGKKTVAVTNGRILGADENRQSLRKRLAAEYPGQPILYVEADAKQLEPLIWRGPRLE